MDGKVDSPVDGLAAELGKQSSPTVHFEGENPSSGQCGRSDMGEQGQIAETHRIQNWGQQ